MKAKSLKEILELDPLVAVEDQYEDSFGQPEELPVPIPAGVAVVADEVGDCDCVHDDVLPDHEHPPVGHDVPDCQMAYGNAMFEALEPDAQGNSITREEAENYLVNWDIDNYGTTVEKAKKFAKGRLAMVDGAEFEMLNVPWTKEGHVLATADKVFDPYGDEPTGWVDRNEFLGGPEGPGEVDRFGEGKVTDFDKYMDKILVSEGRGRPAVPPEDNPQRRRAAKHQDRPGNKIRFGVK